MAPPAPTLNGVEEQIQQLRTEVQALALQNEDYYINVQPQETSDNPLAGHEENRMIISIEQGIPEFHGGQSAEEFLDWLVTVEETLEVKRLPLEQCVPIIAMRFRGRAAAWWSQLKASRARLGKPRILSWDKLKKKMRKAFLPFNYDQVMFQRLHRLQQGNRSVKEYSLEFFSLLMRVDLKDSDQQIVTRFVGGLSQEIQDHLNLLNPLTLAQAHQQAVTVEAKKKAKKKNRNLLNENEQCFVWVWSVLSFGISCSYVFALAFQGR